MPRLEFVVCFSIVYLNIVMSSGLTKDTNPSNTRSGQKSSARYYLSVDSVQAFDARRICSSIGGQLATIQNNDDVKALQQVLEREDDRYEFWTGGRLLPEKSCQNKPFSTKCWFWYTEADDEFYDPTLIQFSDRAQALDVVYSTSYITIIYENMLQLEIRDASNHHPFICDLKPSFQN